VDDSSPDGTAMVVRTLGAEDTHLHLLVRPAKSGLGSAYLAGFQYAISNLHATYIVQMDADLSHPAHDIARLLTPLRDSAELTLASRYVPGGGAPEWPIQRRLVSRVANLLARVFLRLPVHDATTGFRGLRAPLAARLLRTPSRSGGFAFQVESLRAAVRARARIREVPFMFQPRRRGRTKLSGHEVLEFAVTLLRLAGGKL
jgi:dolichol-phosphate mannosyltransferase